MQGYALSQLLERFQIQSVTLHPQFAEYVLLKYGKRGYKRGREIEFNPEWSPEHSTERYRWVENASKGLRYVGKSSEIIKLRHTGWYVDNFQDETVHGKVFQLPARNGSPQYIPAVNDPCNDDAYVMDFHSVTDDKEDAARWADHMAERYAEDARIDQAKQDAEIRLEEIETEITDIYQDFRRIAKELRANCDAVKGIAVVRELVKEKWQATKEHIRKLKREQKRIEDYGIEY